MTGKSMTIAYFDCFSGISGDMCLGAIIDAGLPLKSLEKELRKIPVSGYRLSAKKAARGHLKACKVDVVLQRGTTSPKAVKWKDIQRIIHDSNLSKDIKKSGLSVFRTIFEAEARVHGRDMQAVHLHELGATDCIIDVFGTLAGLNLLGVEKIYSSPVNLGQGMVRTEHGFLPVPAPATLEILKELPVYSSHVHAELTTPTGAAILKELSSGCGDVPLMNIEKIGIGAGSHDFPDWPNFLRIFIGSSVWKPAGAGSKESPEESVTVVETNIDDMNPQLYEHITDTLLKAGAIDVFLTQIIMKKGRPGIKLNVLCDRGQLNLITKLILKETSSIGLRYYEMKRQTMQREIKKVDTQFGEVRFKFSRLGDEIIKYAPEYEDCRKIARRLKIPLIEVIKKTQQKKHP